MEKDLFAEIKRSLPSMSKGHKLIANYILDHYDKAAFMTAAKLGQTVGVSESTVVRLASELGFEGYPALQRAIQDVMRNKLTSVQRIDVTSNQIGDSDIMEKVLTMDIEKIRKTLEESSKEDFNQCVDKIMNSRTIYIIGARSAAALASFLKYYFNLIFPNVKLVTASTSSEMFEQIMRIDSDDVIIGISFPRYSNQTVTALKYAKANGAKVIAVTDSPLSPLVQYADNVLMARSDMASFVDSLVAPLSLINALIVAVSMRARDRVADTFNKLETIWEEYRVYSKNDNKQDVSHQLPE